MVQRGPSHQHKYIHHNLSSVTFTYHTAGEVTILTANVTLLPQKRNGSEREGNAAFKKNRDDKANHWILIIPPHEIYRLEKFLKLCEKQLSYIQLQLKIDSTAFEYITHKLPLCVR